MGHPTAMEEGTPPCAMKLREDGAPGTRLWCYAHGGLLRVGVRVLGSIVIRRAELR